MSQRVFLLAAGEAHLAAPDGIKTEPGWFPASDVGGPADMQISFGDTISHVETICGLRLVPGQDVGLSPDDRGLPCSKCTKPCGRMLYWWDGEYESNCELPTDHEGPHYDGSYWFNDDNEEVPEP